MYHSIILLVNLLKGSLCFFPFIFVYESSKFSAVKKNDYLYAIGKNSNSFENINNSSDKLIVENIDKSFDISKVNELTFELNQDSLKFDNAFKNLFV